MQGPIRGEVIAWWIALPGDNKGTVSKEDDVRRDGILQPPLKLMINCMRRL